VTRVVLATANPDKAREMREILVGVDLELVTRPPEVSEVVEDGDTLAANALKKARALVAATGDAALSDDTGLFVDALDGEPGIYAARYAGEDATYADNVNKLLQAMTSTEPSRRTAQFVTVVALVYPDGREIVAEGALQGRIGTAPVGEYGFGYDPVFVPDDNDGRTLAQLTASEKSACSHRGRALRALLELVRL